MARILVVVVGDYERSKLISFSIFTTVSWRARAYYCTGRGRGSVIASSPTESGIGVAKFGWLSRNRDTHRGGTIPAIVPYLSRETNKRRRRR